MQLDSCHAIDAFVIPTVATLGSAVVLCSDPDDLRRLATHVTVVAGSGAPVGG